MNQSASAVADQICATLQAPGAPFEITEVEINDRQCRIFKQGLYTLSEVFKAAQTFKDRELFVFNDLRMRYAEGLGRAAALQSELRQLGARRGDRIAIVMHNCPEWMIAFIAISAFGATAVLVNSRGTASEIASALEITDSKIIIADAVHAALLPADQHLPAIVVGADANNPNWIDFEAVTRNWQSAELAIVDMSPEDEATIMFTSGTTGLPKAALLTHRGAMSCVMNTQYSRAHIGVQMLQLHGPDAIAAAAQRQSVALLIFPLFHSSGCYTVLLPSLLNGGKIVILPKWNAEEALTLIEREKIGGLSGSPTMLWDMLQVNRSTRDLSSLVSIGVGGQALHTKLMQNIVAAFPNATLGIGYGMTETNGSVCQVMGSAILERPTISGRALPTADLKIVDDNGATLPTDAVGEICVRGGMLMREYCKQPAATEEALRDGWLHTGDIGRIDADGYLHVVDRKKNIIIAGGENISCSEVEGAALEIEAIAQAVAFGLPDERLGERIVLAIVLRPSAEPGAEKDAQISEEDIKRRIGEKLAIYKVPREIFRFAELPHNAMGKIMRNAVREQILKHANSST